MAGEWRDVALEDVADELTVGFVGPMASEYVDSGIPFLRSMNVDPLRINRNDLKFITPEFHQRIRKSRLTPGDVVIVRTGKPGACSVVPDWLADANCSDLVIVRCGTQLDNRFLAYYVNTVACNHIAAHLVGAVQQHFNVGSARTLRLNLPPLREQKASASVLGALDDLIEVNRETNETLEEMARALFKSWFVDFDPVRAKLEGRPPAGMDAATAALFPDHFQDSELGQIPKGWEVKPLSKNIELLSGGTPKTSEPSYWDGEIPWYSVRDAPSDTDVWVVDTDRKITPLGVSDSAASILPEKTTINSARGTVGKLALIGRPMAMNQSCYGVRGAAGYREFFTFYALKEGVEEFQQNAHGSVFDTITRETFSTLNVASPPITVADAFEALVEPLMETILANVHESRDLAALRDTLLPKLLSGEVSVERVEKRLAEIRP